MRRLLALLLLVAVGADAQDLTELYDCVDDANGPDFCTSDSTAVLVEEGCGATFNRYHGVIAWPVLRNVGPVTISVQTRRVHMGTTHLPLYIELVQRVDNGCRAVASAQVAMVAQGGNLCGGVWESVGPIDLRSLGVSLGDLYSVQAVFLQSLPGQILFHTVGFSCLRITSHPNAVALTTWSNLKRFYRD